MGPVPTVEHRALERERLLEAADEDLHRAALVGRAQAVYPDELDPDGPDPSTRVPAALARRRNPFLVD